MNVKPSLHLAVKQKAANHHAKTSRVSSRSDYFATGLNTPINLKTIVIQSSPVPEQRADELKPSKTFETIPSYRVVPFKTLK